MPAGFGVAQLKCLMNALNTSRRYRNKKHGGLIVDCPFCGHLGGDDLFHILSCPNVNGQIRERWYKLETPKDDKQALQYYSLLDRPNKEQAMIRFILCDLVFKAYQSWDGQQRPAVFLFKAFEERIAHWSRGDVKVKYSTVIDDMNKKLAVRPRVSCTWEVRGTS